MTLAKCSGAASQNWKVVAAAAPYSYVENAASGLCMDIHGGSGSAGALIQQYTCVPVRPEYFEPTSSGTILSPNMANGCLQALTSSVEQNTCNGSASQVFQLTAPQVSVSISPTSAAVASGKTKQFSASVSGSTNTAVTWSTSAGSISTSGLLTAPTCTSNMSVAVTATSQANTSVSALAAVTVQAPAAADPSVSVSVSPTSATVLSAGTQQFTATVTGSTNTAVTWSTTAGSVSSSGLLTAPTVTANTNITVKATSQASSGVSASATVTVDPPGNVSISISPTVATVSSGGTEQFTATVTGSTDTAVTWSSTDGSISTSGLYTAPAVTSTTTATITATSQASTSKSASASVSIDPTTAGINPKNYGATGNGTTDDTAAIQSAIAALKPGDTLSFPAGTYKVTGVLTINVPNVTIDGSNNTATISMQSSSGSLRFGACSGISCSLTNGVALAATANELATSFTTEASLGASAGSYIFLNQGGEDSSDGSDDLGCDVSGCRGEVLQVATVSGNTYTVAIALHDTYVPTSGGTMGGGFSSGCNLSSGVGNCATAWLMSNPLTGITLQNITIDGTNVATLPVGMFGVVNSTVSNVTIERTNTPSGNGTYSLLANVTYGLTFTNVTLTSGTALAEMGVYQHGNLTINGMTISGSAGGAAYLSAGANDSVTNMTINDAGNTTSRPFKTTATRHSTFNGLTVENGSGSLNGISLEYYSSHNTFSGCVVQNNAGGNGSAGINSFGNFNQYNTFSNCTVSGNGNVQIYISDADALGLAQDSNDAFISNTIGGSGTPGLLIFGANACVNNNVFQSGLGAGIEAEGSGTMGSGNVMNGDSSNLTTGTCTAP